MQSGTLKYVVIIALLVVLVVVGLYNVIDLRVAYLKIQNSFKQEKEADTIKNAEILLQSKMTELLAQIGTYEKRLQEEKIQIFSEQSMLDKAKALDKDREDIKAEFARLYKAADAKPFSFYGKSYSSEAAYEQLEYYVQLSLEKKEEIVQAEAQLDAHRTMVNELEQAIRTMRSQTAEIEHEIVSAVSALEVSEIQKKTNELTAILNGTSSTSGFSGITTEIHQVLGLLDEQILRNSYTSDQIVQTQTGETVKLMGYEATVAARKINLREAEVKAEIDALLGLNVPENPGTGN
jgi:hypothetical protein